MARQTANAGGKDTLSLPTSADELAKLCESLGWEVVVSPIGYRISNGFAPPITVSKNLSNGRSLPNAHQGLKRLGILKIWAEKIEADKLAKAKLLDDDRRRNANKLEEIQRLAEARNALPAPATDPKEIFVAPSTTRTRTPAKATTAAPPPAVGEDTPPEPYSEYKLVTPEDAEELVTRPLPWRSNGERLRQRPVNEGWVTDLSVMIKENRWRKIHQGIALAPGGPHNTGGVCDGQHRLLAIIKAGKPAILNVNYNADPDNFVVFDTQRTRTGAQTLAIGGESNSHLLASTLKLTWLYDMWEADPDGDVPGDWWEWNRNRFPNDLSEIVLERHPTLREDVLVSNGYKNKPLSLSAASVAVFRYKARQVAPWVTNPDFDWEIAVKPGFDIETVEERFRPGFLDIFMFKLRYGYGLANEPASQLAIDPAVKIRSWLQLGMHRKVTLKDENDKHRNVPGREVTLLKLIAAYNKACKGEPLRQVKVAADEKMGKPGVPTKRLW